MGAQVEGQPSAAGVRTLGPSGQISETPLDSKSAIEKASEDAKGLVTQFEAVEAQFSALHSQLPDFVKTANRVVELADPGSLRKMIAELRVVQAMGLQLGLGIALTRSHAGELRDALDEIENRKGEGQIKELEKESRLLLSNVGLSVAQMERKLEYFKDAETRTNDLFRRTEEMISAARADVEDANNEAFRRRIEVYGAMISAFIAAFAGVTIALELLRALKIIG